MDGFNQSNYLHINTNAQAMTWTSQHIQSSSHTSLHTQNPIQTHVHQHTYKLTQTHLATYKGTSNTIISKPYFLSTTRTPTFITNYTHTLRITCNPRIKHNNTQKFVFLLQNHIKLYLNSAKPRISRQF